MEKETLRSIVRFLFRALSRLEYYNLEYLPTSGPAILATNHLSHVDTPVMFVNPRRQDATALITEWADAVLFATRKIITKTEDGGFGRDRTIAAGLGKDGGERVLRCVGSPACVAKNRYSLPAELSLSWPALMNGIVASTSNVPQIQEK